MHLCLQNDLEFLRIRSFKHEIMVAASEFMSQEQEGLRSNSLVDVCTRSMQKPLHS